MADIWELLKQIAKKEEPPHAPITWILAGLGNPGEKYRFTRHNAGFLTVDAIAEKCNVKIDRAKFHALCTEAQIGTHRVLLLKPQTMMNASGLAVQEAADFYKIPADHILIISDDITQNPGKMRLRRKGSAGGQKGLVDIIRCLDTEEFPRLRMGVGAKPHPDFDLAEWVLSSFSKEELALLEGTVPSVWKSLPLLLDGDFDAAVQICNSYTPQTTV